MKAYALTALCVVAAAGLAFAVSSTSHAAGIGAAAGVGKTLVPAIDLAGNCSGSIDPERKIWLAGDCGSGADGGGGGGSGKKGKPQSMPMP